MELKTPLYDAHTALGGKMVPYAGYLLPVQYTGIVEEHMAVRNAAGLFDVSHMGEFLLTGARALETLNRLLTNDFTTLKPGRVRYSPMCREDGGILDDLLVYCLDKERYLLVVNACNRAKDADWIRERLSVGVIFEDLSDHTAQIALQGPCAGSILFKVACTSAGSFYSFQENCDVRGMDCLISRTGYTGGFGYELYCLSEDAPRLWEALLDAGRTEGLIPCGLGARDTLRLEAGLPLYGHEMDETVNPFEAGLGAFVKNGKLDHLRAPRRIRAGLKVTGRGIARENYPVYIDEKHIGTVTSGTHLPSLDGAYAMALVGTEHSAAGTAVEIDVRGRRVSAVVVNLPFKEE